MGEAGALLFKGHSSRLQLLIEKIQANKENHNVTEQDLKDALGTEGVSSWTGSEGQSSPPSSCATPNSATELADSELAFTVGVTEATPYACQFCDKAFPRLSYLKKHEQTHSDHLPFICEFCKRRFKHKRSKDRHLKLHTGDKRYKCSQCQAAFARSDHLKIHMKTHDNQKPFQCTICNRGYNTAAALTSHMQNHKKSSEPDASPSGSTFKCLECSEVFSKPELLTSHMTEHQGNTSKRRASPSLTRLGCMYCTKDNFSSVEALQLHIQAMHGSILKGSHRYGFSKGLYLPNGLSSSGYACRLCTMVFPSSGTLQAHAAVAHGIQGQGSGTEEHQCPQCSLSFRSLNSFAEHFILSHGAPPPPGKSKSGADQVLPTDLSVVRKEQNDKPPAAKRSRGSAHPPDPPRNSSQVVQYDHPGILLCNQCNAALPDFESFRSHLKSHLEESTFSPAPPPIAPSRLPQLNICSYCGAHLPSADELTRHIGTHFLSTITEYGCQSCYQLFQKPEDLQRHLLELHAQNWYRCTLCKELFESQAAIQAHFAVKHCSETKQYRCAACPNAPSLHSELEFSLHIRAVHCTYSLSPNPPVISSPRLHRCIFCNLTFNSDIEMQFHLAVHTKLFQCPVCNEAFHVEYFLEKHMQLNHPNQNSSVRHGSYEKKIHEGEKPLNGFHPSPSNVTNFNLNANTNGSTAPESGKRPEISSHHIVNSHSNNNNNINNNNNNINNNNSIGTCDICESGEFTSEAELNAHRKLVHHLKTSSTVTKVSLHCAYCKESCKSRTELENHMKSYCQAAIGSSKHKCNICDELCLSAAILAEHKLTHCKVVHGSTCTHCKALITNEDSFISHSIQHSNSGSSNSQQQLVLPNACVICRQTLTSEMETRLHAKFHLQTDVVKCSMCLQNYERAEMADGVCKSCHKRARTSPCVCVHCHIQFESASLLELHMAKTHKQSFKCSKCKEVFESEKDYERHSSGMCGGDNVFKCRLCLLLFPGPTQLQSHLIEHTFAGCPNFTCYICSAVFTTATGLQGHILEHGLSARPYDCSKCSKKFFFRSELENHSFMHIESTYQSADQGGSMHFTDTHNSLFKTESDSKSVVKNHEGARPSQNGLNLIKQTHAHISSGAPSDSTNNSNECSSPLEAASIKMEATQSETKSDIPDHAEISDVTIKTEQE